MDVGAKEEKIRDVLWTLGKSNAWLLWVSIAGDASAAAV